MNGVINVLKPPAMSLERRDSIFEKGAERKTHWPCGDAGPGAAGVLVVLLGRAARAVGLPDGA